MAKVTLTLEDIVEPDGKPGLVIDYDADNDYTKESLAHAYATSFVEHIIGQSKKTQIIDKDGDGSIPKPPKETDLN